MLELPAQPGPGRAPEYVTAVVLGAGDQRIAFAVDAVLQEQEVLVKSLGQLLARVRNVAGATVLGSGKPVVILNAADLLKSAVRHPAAGGASGGVPAARPSRGTAARRPRSWWPKTRSPPGCC